VHQPNKPAQSPAQFRAMPANAIERALIQVLAGNEIVFIENVFAGFYNFYIGDFNVHYFGEGVGDSFLADYMFHGAAVVIELSDFEHVLVVHDKADVPAALDHPDIPEVQIRKRGLQAVQLFAVIVKPVFPQPVAGAAHRDHAAQKISVFKEKS
jgi:hypothetical protein